MRKRRFFRGDPRPKPDGTGQRAVVVHYHLFKNAGTSLDRTLRENFQEAWTQLEAPPGQFTPPDVIERHIVRERWIMVLSSHSAVLPPPEPRHVTVVPVLFLRHPLDRIRAIHDFERRQVASTAGARAAKEMDLAGYIRWRLDRVKSDDDRTAANSQTHRLARGTAGPSMRDAAVDTVARLAFIGLVEAYGPSMARLADILARHFDGLDLRVYHDNAGQLAGVPLAERLDRFREQLGDPLYEELQAANANDMYLWEEVRTSYAP